MEMKKTVVGLASALILAAVLPVTAQASQHSSSHYMMHGGNGPQGHMMEGAEHDSGKTQLHQQDYKGDHKARANNKAHYMMHGGDGPQGHMMEGAEHNGAKSQRHVVADDFGAKLQAKSNMHYMMNSGDGPQGYMMDGQQHPQ